MGRKNKHTSLLAKAKPHLQRRIAVRCALFANNQAPPHILKALSLLLSPYFLKERYGGAEHVISGPVIPDRTEF
jgi:hypothetical protein